MAWSRSRGRLEKGPRGTPRCGSRDVERALDVAFALHPILLRRGPIVLDLELLDAAIDAALGVLVDATRLARALAARSFVHVSLGNLAEAAADCDRALLLDAADAQAEVLVEAGLVRWFRRGETGEVDDARTCFTRAIAIAIEVGAGRDARSAGQALKLLGGLHTSLGDDREARDCFARAIAAAKPRRSARSRRWNRAAAIWSLPRSSTTRRCERAPCARAATSPDHAARRVYRAVWTIRKLGLDALLLRRDGVYLLDPAIPTRIVDDTAAPA